MRNYNAECLLQIGCSQEEHSYPTQRSESIQSEVKRHVRFRVLLNHQSIVRLLLFTLCHPCSLLGRDLNVLRQIPDKTRGNDQNLRQAPLLLGRGRIVVTMLNLVNYVWMI
jgi:hypothetical protein